MRKSILLAASAFALTALTVTAAQADHHEEAETSGIASGTYTADASHSMIGWSVSHLGFNDYLGILGDVEGTLVLDTETVSNSTVDVTIPLASVIVASEGLRDHMLRTNEDGSADFFGSDPAAARFVSTSVHATGDTTAHITGDLTLNGVTNEVTIQAELSGTGTNMMNQKSTVGFHGSTTITRSEFDMGWGVPFGIGDDVELFITVAFEM